MFRLSIVLACWAAAAEAFAPGMPLASAKASSRAVTSRAVSGLRMQSKTSVQGGLTKELFTKLDVDGSGTLDASEIMQALGGGADVEAFMARADLNGDGTIDYAEYERLMNMAKNDDAQGGNLFVRSALKFGLLKKGSVLEDCVLVGNKGFDPLGLAKNEAKLMDYREAELKHGRLAMLAAAGWPVSELVQPYLSKLVGAPDLLAAGAKAPSVLNGGLDAINPAFFMAIIIFTATVESIALNTPRTAGQKPGDLNFDPLRLYYGKTEDVKRDLELKELNNGRLAMLAITGFAAQEFITQAPVA